MGQIPVPVYARQLFPIILYIFYIIHNALTKINN